MSRDVTWLNKTFATFKGIDGVVVVDEEDDEPLEAIVTGTNQVAVVPQPQVATVAALNVPAPAANVPAAVQNPAPVAATTVVDPKVASELNRLDANIEDVDVSQGRTLRSGRELGHLTIDDLALFTVVNRGSMFPDFALKNVDPTNLKPAQYKDFLETPTCFNDAWNHPCETQRKLWREAIGVELAKMMTYKVWRKVKRHLVPKNRKCVKCMDKATEAAYKEMLRVVKFVLDTKEFGLFLKPEAIGNDGSWHLTVYSDSDWAGDLDNRRSISGYIIFLLGCPIVWKSKQQQSVTLSSSEAEYVALSEAAKEIKFVAQVLESIGIKVKYPITVHVDNIGAIFMSENVSATKQTRHVHTRYRFVYEEVEDGRIVVRFVKTEDNKADPYTKNVKSEIYDRSVSDYMMSKQQFDSREGVGE
jgi:hypothetical protein